MIKLLDQKNYIFMDEYYVLLFLSSEVHNKMLFSLELYI